MSRILFEITVRDKEHFLLTARRDMKSDGVLYVKVGKEPQKRVLSKDLELPVKGLVEIRQEIPNFGGAKPSSWHFKISLLS
jgi:hypothetical protein